MVNIVLFGPPGAGKGTQSEKLIKKYGFVHISTGDLFRWHTKNETELGKRVKEIMNNGMLVPDEITIAMLKEVYDEHPDAASIVVSLLGNGWTMTPSGEHVICVTLRSQNGEHEVLGHGPTVLDAFEAVQLKTKNFSKLLSGVEV